MNKIDLVGCANEQVKQHLINAFKIHGFIAEFKSIEEISTGTTISLSKVTSKVLEEKKIKFFNWDLLLSVLGPNDTFGEIQSKVIERIKILQSIMSVKVHKANFEIHGSIRVKDLAESARFYTWLFGVEPKEWTHRYVTFHQLGKFNFVLLVSDGKELHHDTLYHLGIGHDLKLSTLIKVANLLGFEIVLRKRRSR